MRDVRAARPHINGRFGFGMVGRAGHKGNFLQLARRKDETLVAKTPGSTSENGGDDHEDSAEAPSFITQVRTQ